MTCHVKILSIWFSNKIQPEDALYFYILRCVLWLQIFRMINRKNSKLWTVTLIHSFRTTIYQVTWGGRIDFFSSTTFWFEAFSAVPYIWLTDIHTIKNIVFIVLQWKWTVTCSGLCCQAIKHSERWWQRVAFFCDLDWLVQHVWCLVRGTARLPRWIPTVNTRNIEISEISGNSEFLRERE